jgi:hypothetical protein
MIMTVKADPDDGFSQHRLALCTTFHAGSRAGLG